MTSNVKRAFAILELVAGKADGLHLQEVADALALPPSAAHRHLGELTALGYVRPGGRPGSYVATTKLVSLGFAILAERGIVDLAQPILDGLAALSGELVRLAVRDGPRLTFVARAQGARGGLIYDGDMGREPVLFATATGLAWLSCLADDEAVRLIERQGLGPPNDLAPRTPATMGEVLGRIAATRRIGYGLVIDSATPGTSAIAVPVREAGGDVLGTISVAGPTVRFTEEKLKALVRPLKAAAEHLVEMRLGSPALSSRKGWILADDPRFDDGDSPVRRPERGRQAKS